MNTSPRFSVILFTAPPPGQSAGAIGAMVRIDGRETLLRTVELFLNRDEVESICVVFDPNAADEARAKFGGHFGFSGVKLATGGPRWIDQLIAAKEKIAPSATHVIIHDAARPAVPYTELDAISDLASKHDAIVTAVPLQGNLIEVDDGGNPLATATANQYRLLTSPMVFSRAVFEQIVKEQALPHASRLTLVEGSILNVRVGHPSDVSIVKALIGLLPKPKAKASSPFEEAKW